MWNFCSKGFDISLTEWKKIFFSIDNNKYRFILQKLIIYLLCNEVWPEKKKVRFDLSRWAILMDSLFYIYYIYINLWSHLVREANNNDEAWPEKKSLETYDVYSILSYSKITIYILVWHNLFFLTRLCWPCLTNMMCLLWDPGSMGLNNDISWLIEQAVSCPNYQIFSSFFFYWYSEHGYYFRNDKPKWIFN